MSNSMSCPVDGMALVSDSEMVILVGFGLIGIITVGLVEVLEVLVAELVGADKGSDLGVTDVVELAHEAGGSQGEETLDGARERGHG